MWKTLCTWLVGGGNEGHGAFAAGAVALHGGKGGTPPYIKVGILERLGEDGGSIFSFTSGKEEIYHVFLGCLYTPKLPFEFGKCYFH